MSSRLHWLLAAVLSLTGCAYDTQQRIDRLACATATSPCDAGPFVAEEATSLLSAPNTAPSSPVEKPRDAIGTTDAQTASRLESAPPAPVPAPAGRIDLNIPAEIPGAESRRIELSRDPGEAKRQLERLFPDLPPLVEAPNPLPGPNGKPYTLSDLQQIAATNSPQLRQAAADVEAARGNLIQAKAYPNPSVSYQFTPSNNGSTPGADGVGVEQTIKTGGKLRLQASAAEMDVRNAELALRRSRSDLATQVRGAYFAILVSKETVRVNKALAAFTDEVYRVQARMVSGGFAAPYEPAALRAQAYAARLSYRQAVQNYVYAWKQLVAVLNIRQLPLSEVAGRVDSYIPCYDYDAVLSHVLSNHTDVLTARNGIEKARYNLKLAQVTPVPDVDVGMSVLRDYSMAPKQATPTLSLSVPVPLWDRNKGAVVAAESALVRAAEEPHRVERNLTAALAAAFANYRTSLESLEYYRRYILPDQVAAYRGAYDRRQVDPNASFADVVSAQQTLASNVTSYLQSLGQTWAAVTGVADLMQTDDLFDGARSQVAPPLAPLEELAALACCHPCVPGFDRGDAHRPESPDAGEGDRSPGGVRRSGVSPLPSGVRRELPREQLRETPRLPDRERLPREE